MTNKQIRPCVIQRRIALVQPIQNTKSAASGSLPRRRFSVADQSEHFTAKPPLKKKVFVQYLFGGPEETRTLDLSDANRTLSQLSYRPELHRTALKTMVKIDLHERFQDSMVHFVLHTCGSDCGIL